MKITLTYLAFALLLVYCKSEKKGVSDEMPPLYPPPLTVDLNTEGGYIVNPVTGDSIHPIINSFGDTIKTGIPILVKGKTIHPDSVAQPKRIPAGNPKVFPGNQNVHKIPESLTVIPVNWDSLKKFTHGNDTTAFVLVNYRGDTIPTGVPLPAKGKVERCIQPQPVKALLPRVKDNATMSIKYLDVEQGMSISSITSIMADHRGNIWMGTWDAGVSMYNGESFMHFTEKEGLSNDIVLSLLEDRHGNLWFGTVGGGVSMYDGETFTHFTEKEGICSNNVWSCIEDKHGNLWFGTDKGVSRFDGESFTHFTSNEGLSNNFVRSILEDKNGNLWFGTIGGGLSVYDGESFTHFTEKEGLSNNDVQSILEDKHGNLWFGTNGGGVSMFDGESFTHFTEKEGLACNSIWSILEDRHGNLWFGAVDNGGGVYRYDGETFTHFTEKDGLNGYGVRSIVEDNHGNLWFAQNRGVSMYDGDTFSLLTVQGLRNFSFRSILEDKHGNLWFCTYGGGMSRSDGDNFAIFTKEEGLSSNNVWSSVEDKHGNIWFGTNDGGVSMYDGETFTHFTEKEGLSSNSVRSMLEDSHGNLWFGTNAGVSMYDGETFTRFTEKEGLIHNTVHSVMEDHKGNLWIGTVNGVSMYNGRTFTHFTEKEGLSDNDVRTIREDHLGNIWFASSEGVSRYNGDAFTHFTKDQGLSYNVVHSILEDSSNNIWLGTREGLSCLVFAPDMNYSIYSYSTQDGLKDLMFSQESALSDSKNRIWWGSYSGATMLDPSNYNIPVEAPAVQLNRIEINNQFLDYRYLQESVGTDIEFTGVAKFYNYPLNLEVPYNLNHLTFHFSAIDWSAPYKMKYSYRMEGLNDHWSLPTSEAKADFRSLPYGSYTFKIRAIGAAQKWSEPFEYTFTIHPPWWHTWWARAGYIITALLLILGVLRWRTARLKQRQIELVNEVRNATKEIKSQKEEVESQRDEIEAQRNQVTEQKDKIQKQKEAMTDSIEYAKRIQAATFPPDEVLRYLLPKHFILYKPLDIVSGDFYWLTQKKEKIIIAVADCTGHGVPGAFMSMLGSALLNDIVNKIKDTPQANLILNELRDQVIASLRQTGAVDEARDGMDISLCIIDRDHMKLQYAGAHNPLYHIRNGKLTEVKADMMPIGISSEAAKSFTNHELTLHKDDTLYLFSDGYTDQFGGERRKRFTTSRFKQLLLEMQDRIMFDQKAILERKLDEWMDLNGLHESKYEQIDDILVMGIRIN